MVMVMERVSVRTDAGKEKGCESELVRQQDSTDSIIRYNECKGNARGVETY